MVAADAVVRPLWLCDMKPVLLIVCHLDGSHHTKPGRAHGVSLTMVVSYSRLILALGVICLVMAVVSLFLGPADLGIGETLGALFGKGEPNTITIVQMLRLPRTLLAALIGATLALAGAGLQGLIRNPLAAPEILGAPGFAGFFAVAAIALGLASVLSFALPVAAIFGAFVSVGLLLMLTGPNASIITLILAGLALSSLAGALIALTLNLAPNPYAALEIAFWLLGSLENRSFEHLVMSGPLMILSWILLLSSRSGLTALSLGEDVARSSGVDVDRLRIVTLVGVACGVGATVAVAGIIGFVGLVTPHLVRGFVGGDPARVHVPAMLAGATLVLTADCATRIIPSAGEIHIGVVTALIGVPFFIWLVLCQRAGVRIAEPIGPE